MANVATVATVANVATVVKPGEEIAKGIWAIPNQLASMFKLVSDKISKTAPQVTKTVLGTINYLRLLGFAIMMIILFFIILLINREVISKHVGQSRCVANRNAYNKGSIYRISAKTSDGNQPLYHILYDLNRKTTKTECDCKKGDIMNSFPVTLRDLNLQIDRPNNINCMCDTNFTPDIKTGNVFYSGNPALVAYQNGNGGSQYATFFTQYIDPVTQQSVEAAGFQLPVPPTATAITTAVDDMAADS